MYKAVGFRLRMSIVTLLITISIAWALSMVADTLPGLNWVRLPNWILWGIAIALIAWCMDSDESPMD